MIRYHRFAAAALLSAACSLSAFAATKEEATAQVNAAIAHIKKVGLE